MSANTEALRVAPEARKKATKTRKRPAAKQGLAPRSKSNEANGISDDAIRIRAYFISEARSQFGIPGDAAVDWIEAHRQLLDESRREESAADSPR